jgi:pimeloyl-ACP methyl ester carboxylesterase
MRNRDPCGDATSLTSAAVTNFSGLGEVEQPVLLLFGTSDAVYDQPAAGEQQRDAFSGSDDVTLRFFAGTGHALALERAAPAIRGAVSRWLARRGF